MTCYGTVKDGVVVLGGDATIPDGTKVRIETVETALDGNADHDASTLFQVAERAKPTGIPDLAINHDHYLYGHPKAD